MGGHMLAWLELIGGAVVVVGGIAVIVDAANSPEQSIDDEKYAVRGLIALVFGGMFFLLGLITLVTRLLHLAVA
jgi:hypothetical protein